MEETTSTIMSALSTLSPSQLTDLTHTILSHILHHHRRLSLLLSSPSLFSLTLRYLNSLTLPCKTLLIARHLLSLLHNLTCYFHPKVNLPPHSCMKQRDLDAVLLLLLLCELQHQSPDALKAPVSAWMNILNWYCSDTMLKLSGVAICNGSLLVQYIENIARCWRFVVVMCSGTLKAGKEVAASRATVVGLPSVEVKGEAVECAVCREEMNEGRDVCMLPCEHLFHWMCILPWLRKKNTCPCCRLQLPTDDVFGEIQRLWGILIKMENVNHHVVHHHNHHHSSM